MKKIIIPFLLIILILLSSCSGVGLNSNKETKGVDFHKGTQGLTMKFVNDAPASKIFENSQLSIMVEYSNKGVFDIRAGKIYLSGFDRTYIDPQPDYLPNLEADGKDIFNPDGRITQTTTFSDHSIQLPEDVDRLTQTIKATACYNYRTEASTSVCINPKKNTNIRQDICQIRPISLSGGQGAPIAVTKIEEEIYKNKLQFKIYFENVGSGTVYLQGHTRNCHTTLDRAYVNKIEVNEVSFSGKTMRCEPRNPITLDDRGNGFIFCYYEGNLGDDAYETVLNIKLDYGYRDTIQTNVEILQEP